MIDTVLVYGWMVSNRGYCSVSMNKTQWTVEVGKKDTVTCHYDSGVQKSGVQAQGSSESVSLDGYYWFAYDHIITALPFGQERSSLPLSLLIKTL